MKKKRFQKSHSSFTPLPYVAIVLGAVGLMFVGKMVISSFENKTILGTNTKYLARGGDNSSNSSGSGSDSSGSSDSGGSGSGSSNSGSSDLQVQPTRTDTRTDTGIRTQTETKSDETRTEVKLSEGERIRTRTKDGRTRIDITSGRVKTRLEIRDDRVVVKAEQEDGTEVELEDNTLLKIDERLGASGIKIATAGAERFVIQRGATGAVTNFPLSIDLATNTLTVNTPSGEKTVTVLPDQAVRNLIAANVVNRLGGQAIVDAVKTGNLASISQLILLGEQNGVPVYEINGISDQRLLGFIPIAIKKTVTVSAETGTVVSTQQSLGNRILDLLAF